MTCSTYMSYGEYKLKTTLYYNLGPGSERKWKMRFAWEIVYGLIEDGMGTIDNGDVYVTEGYSGTLRVKWSRGRGNSADEHHFRCELLLDGRSILYAAMISIRCLSDIHCTIPRALHMDALRDANNSGWLIPVMERLGLC